MRKTRSEKLAEELATKEGTSQFEQRLKEMVVQFDLDYDPPYTPQDEAIFMDWAPRRYPELLKVYPSWEYLPEMERTNAVLVVKFNLSSKLSLKDSPAIQKAIGEVLEKKGGSSELFDSALFKFRN